ncbi:hypothetical protein PMAYCL1PPCAC_30160, partial [Pristionchus mayeri]
GGQNGYAHVSSASSPYSLSLPRSQAQTEYVVADSAALHAFSQSISSQPVPGLASSQSSYIRPQSGLPPSTIQYATVPAGVAVDQHLARQIANEAATYVASKPSGNQYVQTKQNAFARQHNPSVNEYARVGSIEGGSAVREQYMTRPQPIPSSAYVNANLHRDIKPVEVHPVIVDVPPPPSPSRAQFSAPSDTEILAAEQSDPMVLPSASQHDAPPIPPAAPVQTTVIESVDTTSLVLHSDDI